MPEHWGASCVAFLPAMHGAGRRSLVRLGVSLCSCAQVVREMDKEELALLVQFVTGTSKVPLEGFKALQARATPATFATLIASKPCTPYLSH